MSNLWSLEYTRTPIFYSSCMYLWLDNNSLVNQFQTCYCAWCIAFLADAIVLIYVPLTVSQLQFLVTLNNSSKRAHWITQAVTVVFPMANPQEKSRSRYDLCPMICLNIQSDVLI